MRAARIPVGRRVLAVLVAVGVVVSLAGCFFDVPPPKGSEAALKALLSKIERIPGVAKATGEVRQVDAKDQPNSWLADIRITANTSDIEVASKVRGESARGVTGTTLSVALDLPKAPGVAPVEVDPMQVDLVDLAGRLRKQSVVESASLTHWITTVTLAGHVTFTDAVTRVRPLLGAGSATLTRPGHSDRSVEVTATSPGASLLRVLDTIDTDPSTSEFSYSAGTTYAVAPQSSAQRSSLFVRTAHASALAETLVRTTDEAAEARVAPRTSFALWNTNDTEGEEGWLGLPLGASPPADEMPVVKTPSPAAPGGSGATVAPQDVWVPANVDAQTAELRTFLDRSAAATAVKSVVTTDIEQCSTSGRSDLAGTRATARTIIPIFTVYNEGQKPFDAVTALWTRGGLRMNDQAMGLQHWVASPAGGAVSSATIQGTTAGLSLTAESGCIG